MDYSMIETIIEFKKLSSSEGMVLTNGNEYGNEVYLGINDSADNWHEITDAEYEKIMQEKEEEAILTENEV